MDLAALGLPLRRGAAALAGSLRPHRLPLPGGCPLRYLRGPAPTGAPLAVVAVSAHASCPLQVMPRRLPRTPYDRLRMQILGYVCAEPRRLSEFEAWARGLGHARMTPRRAPRELLDLYAQAFLQLPAPAEPPQRRVERRRGFSPVD